MSLSRIHTTRAPRARAAAWISGALLALAACGEDGGSYGVPPTGPGGDGGTGNRGAIAIAVATSPVTVVQGQSGTATVTLTRTAPFTAAAEVTLEGAPAGVTGTFAPASIASGSTTSTLTLAAAATAAPGTYATTIRARGTGVADVTAPLSVVVTAAPTPAFTVALSPTSVTVARGASATSTATITRTGGFSGPVAFTATGAPAGVTVTIDPASATANTATITVAAAAGATVGAATVTVTAAGTGVPSQTAALAVNVSAPAATTSATFAFCADQAPLWLAVQDGTGPWTRVAATGTNSYTFNLAADRGGVAYVTRSGASGPTSLTVFYATAAELRGTNAGGTTEVACTLGGKTVNGTVTGLSATESATIAFAASSASVTAATAGGAFQLRNVSSGPHDLIASRVATTITGSDFSTLVNRLIIRRGLNPADNSTLPALDFGAAESFAPATANLTIGNLGADQGFASVGLTTANGTTASFFSSGPGSTATRAYYGVPTAQLATGDLHSLTAFATSGGTATSVRTATLYSRTVTDRTVTLGAALNAPTTTAVASAPYLRLRAQLAAQGEYNRFGGVAYSQGSSSGQERGASVFATGAYAGTSGFDLTIPDLSVAAGWDNAWGLVPGAPTQFTTFATGGTATGLGFLGQAPTDGATVVSASRSGTVP